MTQVFLRLSQVAIRTILACMAFAAFTSIAYLLFLPYSRNSDMAGTMLAGIDMAGGNWRLAGWWLPSDNFFTSDVILYAALAWLEYGAPIALYQAPALIWAGIGCLAVWLTVRGRGFGAGRNGVAAVVTLLVFPIMLDAGPVYKISESPIHNGTILLLLLCFLFLDMATRSSGRWPSWHAAAYVLAAALPMALAVAGDPLALFIGALPVLAASLMRLRQARWRGLQLAICVSTIIATLLAKLLINASPAIGGFQAATLRLSLATPARLICHIGLVIKWLLQFIGADFFAHRIPGLTHPGTAIFLIRAPFVLLFCLAIILIGMQLLRSYRDTTEIQPDYTNALLWFAVVGNLSSLVVSGMMVDEASGRLVIPAFVFGVILLARTGTWGKLAGVYIGFALVCSIGFTSRLLAGRPLAPSFATPALLELARFLRAQNVPAGYGPYWSSAIVTVLTGERVRVNTLWLDGPGNLRPLPWLWRADWYRAVAKPRDAKIFFLVDTGSRDGFSAADVELLMGSPLAAERVGQYLVELYDARNPALTRLAP